jgi:hypothetical protein
MAGDADKTYADHPKEREANRYRMAAEAALQQLDWSIDYLHRINKQQVAAALAANRSRIRRSMISAARSRRP